MKRRTRQFEFVPKEGMPQHRSSPKMPSIGKQIKGFVKTAANVVVSKFEKVSSEDYQARIETCRTCDYSAKRPGETKCSLCGCTMEKKAEFAVAKCDAGKWKSLK